MPELGGGTLKFETCVPTAFFTLLPAHDDAATDFLARHLVNDDYSVAWHHRAFQRECAAVSADDDGAGFFNLHRILRSLADHLDGNFNG